jgi:hypothetical protein
MASSSIVVVVDPVVGGVGWSRFAWWWVLAAADAPEFGEAATVAAGAGAEYVARANVGAA